MTIKVQRITVTIPEGTKGRFSGSWDADFGSVVNWAEIAVSGFRLQYDDADHHIKLVDINASMGNFPDIQPNKVNFWVHGQLADQNEDDPYSGWVYVLIIADVQ